MQVGKAREKRESCLRQLPIFFYSHSNSVNFYWIVCSIVTIVKYKVCGCRRLYYKDFSKFPSVFITPNHQKLILCYTITWHLCVFSLVVDRDLVKGHTQITSHPRHITSADFFFIPQNQRTTITSLDFVSYFFFIRCDVICDLLQYTRTRKNDIYLLNR